MSFLKSFYHDLLFKRSLSSIKISSYQQNPSDKIKLNKLCCIEDWQNSEIKKFNQEWLSAEGFFKGQLPIFSSIHRKFWEWAMGLIAMKRFGKFNKNSLAIGVGAGKELPLFYLANKIAHVYATDLYDASWDENQAPNDFPDNPKKYAPFPYNDDALTVQRMDGRKLSFPSNFFDIAFSFSSIEHFGGKNHSGSLKSLKEIERVLKPEGIAVITTEYIINGTNHPEYFNKKTIFSDLIDKLEMKLVEPLDLSISPRTLDTIIDLNGDGWAKISPHIVLKAHPVLWTSVMMVFQK